MSGLSSVNSCTEFAKMTQSNLKKKFMKQEGDTDVQRHTYLHKKAIQCLDVPL